METVNHSAGPLSSPEDAICSKATEHLDAFKTSWLVFFLRTKLFLLLCANEKQTPDVEIQISLITLSFMWVHVFDISSTLEENADNCEFEAKLIYIVSSRLARDNSENLPQK